jgi:hypothetical protein
VSKTCSSGSVECRKRAFPLTSRERFPSASTVGPDLGERRVAQRFPVFADTEGVTGSNPVAPTTQPLTRGNANHQCLLIGSRVRRRWNQPRTAVKSTLLVNRLGSGVPTRPHYRRPAGRPRDHVIGPILASVRSPDWGHKAAHWTHRPRLRDHAHRHAALFADLGITTSSAAAETTLCRPDSASA